MMLALLLSMVVQAAPSPRVLYEDKCLFCHSEEVTEDKRFTVAQWRRVVAKMRAKSPLLITRHDADVLTQYIVKTLKLVPATAPVRPSGPGPKPTAPPAVAEPPPQPVTPAIPVPEPPMPDAMEETPADPQAEAVDEEGAALVEARCSKCHTLQRVFGRLDSYERSVFTLHRMRLKTGSGISKLDEERIQLFLKAQFGAYQ
jgi:cytochrome c5